MEKEIQEHSLPFMLANPVRAMSFSFCYSLWKWGLKGGNHDLSNEAIESLFMMPFPSLAVIAKLAIFAFLLFKNLEQLKKSQKITGRRMRKSRRRYGQRDRPD